MYYLNEHTVLINKFLDSKILILLLEVKLKLNNTEQKNTSFYKYKKNRVLKRIEKELIEQIEIIKILKHNVICEIIKTQQND